MTVTEVNDAPANFNASREVYAGLAEVLNFTPELNAASKGAANESSQTLRITRIVPGSVVGGTATLNPNGTITFEAPLGSSGVGSFEVETIDNGTTNGVLDGKPARGFVTVNILPFIPSTISGNVWIDDDKDSAVDSGEGMVGGVMVYLTGQPIGETAAFNRTFMTGADGKYSFDRLPPGTYTVSYANPNGAIDGALPNSVTYSIPTPGGRI